MFADNYDISLRSSDPTRAFKLIQKALDSISVWTLKHGFRFSSIKTYLVIFRKNPTPKPPSLQGFQIPICDNTKFLGLMFDQKLTFNLHVENLETKVVHSISILNIYLSPSKFITPQKADSLTNRLLSTLYTICLKNQFSLN